MVVGFDRNLKMIDFANPDGRLLFGIGTEEMAGKSVSALLAETDDRNFRQIELIRDSLLRARQEKRAVYLEYTSTLPASEKVRVAAHVRYENEDLLCFHAMEVTEEDLLHSREVDMTVAIDSESHHLLETIYKNLPVGMELYDRSGRLVEINEVGMKFMGIRDKSDVLGINIFDNPNMPDALKEQLRAGKNIRFSIAYDFDLVKRQYYPTTFTGLRYFEIAVSVVRNDEGEIDKYLFIAQDMTERTLLQNQYEKLYNQRQALLEALPVGVELYDAEGNMSFMNDADARIFGMDKETYTRKRINIYENPNLPQEVRDAIHNREKIQEHIEYSFDLVKACGFYETTRSESACRIACNGAPVLNAAGDMEGYVFILEDVTEAVQAEELLRQSKKKTELAMQAAEIILWELDTRSRLFFAENSSVGGDEGSKTCTFEYNKDFIHPDDWERAKSVIDEQFEGRDKFFRYNVRVLMPGYPDWQYCTVNASPYEKDESGKVVRYVGFCKNNTDLQRRKELQENILNNMPLPIHIEDVEDDFRYVFCNEESQRLFGTREGETIYSILDDKQAKRMQKTDLEVFTTGKPYLGIERIVLKDGRSYDMIVRKNIIYNGNKRLLLNVRWDQSLQNDLKRRAKVLSISMEVMNAYTWFYEPSKDRMSFGEGFDKIDREISEVDTLEKFVGFIHPDDRNVFLDSLTAIMQNENGEWSVQYRIALRSDGVYEWWETRGVLETSLLNDAPYKYVCGMSINIQDHKQTELTLLKNKEDLNQLIRQNEQVLNNTNSGLAYITPDYIVQWENISVCPIGLPHGAYQKGELCYKSAYNRTSPCEDCVLQRAMKSHQLEQVKFFLENKRAVEVFATPVFQEGGELEGIVIRVDDVSDRERMIEELRKAKALAEQSDKLKSAFLANMSHEIRTPLNAIVGFSDLLMNSEERADREEYMQIINTNNELLLKLINDILDLSKYEAGAVDLKYEDFDFSEYFNNMAVSMKQRVTNPNVRLLAVNPYGVCRVRLDKNRIAQVMTNYVTNAIKYTPKGFIEMGYELVEGGIRLYVKDSGIGIQDSKKDKVFQRFEKLDEFAQGTGLGLSITKAITESMGGSVGFESRNNEGSLFWAILPCEAEVSGLPVKEAEAYEPEKAVARAETAKEDAGEERKTILVAEDISSNYLLISAILGKQYRLLHAVNGREAVEMAKTHPADLVLMDMKMPEMDGLTATKEIRKFNTELPIIALSAYAFESDKVAALEAGCNEYLVKPIDKAKLMAVLQKYS